MFSKSSPSVALYDQHPGNPVHETATPSSDFVNLF